MQQQHYRTFRLCMMVTPPRPPGCGVYGVMTASVRDVDETTTVNVRVLALPPSQKKIVRGKFTILSIAHSLKLLPPSGVGWRVRGGEGVVRQGRGGVRSGRPGEEPGRTARLPRGHRGPLPRGRDAEGEKIHSTVLYRSGHEVAVTAAVEALQMGRK